MNRAVVCAVLILVIAAASTGALLLLNRSTDRVFELIDNVILAGEQGTDDDVEAAIDELEGFAPITIQLETTEVGILMRQREDGVFKCSFRSANDVNVSEICQSIGGGGHAKAAGCTIDADLDSAKKMLIEAVERALN